MLDLNLKQDDRVMVKLAYRTELMLLTVFAKDAAGIWFDSYDARPMIESLPVLYFDKKPFEHDWSGYRPPMYIPFAQIEFLLKPQEQTG